MDNLSQGVNAFQNGKYTEAYERLLPLAEQGELRAQLIMARLYYAGHGVPKDSSQYEYWLRKSADNGDKSAKSLVKRLARGQAYSVESISRQAAEFNMFGYTVLPGFWLEDVLRLSGIALALADRFSAADAESTTATNGSRPGYQVLDLNSSDLDMDQLVTRPQLEPLLEQLLSWPHHCCAIQGIEASGGSTFQWNTPGCEDKARLVRVLLPLQRVSSREGAFHMVAGSHHAGDRFARLLKARIAQSPDQTALPDLEIPFSKINLAPGDMLIMDNELVHRSVAGSGAASWLEFQYRESGGSMRRALRRWLTSAQ